MRRREFIVAFGSAAAWPVSAQPQSVPIVGLLLEGSPEGYAILLAAFRQGLGDAGFFEGRNLTIEYRWARLDNARLPELATDLVRRKVAAIATLGSPTAALAAKAATTTIPIVFGLAGDPVELGLVASFNQPGGKGSIQVWELLGFRLGEDANHALTLAQRRGPLSDVKQS